MKDLKQKTIRGGAARLASQAANFILRLVSLMILARLLGPADFGLVGMVTAFTGVLNMFRDFGLSSAAVQRTDVTNEQSSTLFWINLLVGAVLGIIAIAMAPAVVAFYHEPRLFKVTLVLATAFFFNAAGVQHSVLLQRQMRFTALAMINTVALVIGTAIAIGGAKAGYGYWALVAMTVALPLITTIGLWLATAWVPGMPRRRTGIRSMMRFGGTLTLNGLVMYIASNFEKVLLGRYWGVDALGIYGRAYQLINIPTDNLNSAAGEVAFSALSRTKDEPARLRNYFLKGYSLVLAMTLPITLACAFFAEDVVRVLLGAKWMAAAPIFRLLAPTILAFAVLNPLGWLLSSLGLVGRGLKIALVLGPVMILGYAFGLHYGPPGVALAYSATMMLCVIPLIAWAVKGTVISVGDILMTVGRPLISSVIGALLALGAHIAFRNLLAALPLLVMECSILLGVFTGILFYVMGQKDFYLNLLQGFRQRSAVKEEVLASA
jgi:O-antigen/teichoic acid export membrane protein